MGHQRCRAHGTAVAAGSQHDHVQAILGRRDLHAATKERRSCGLIAIQFWIAFLYRHTEHYVLSIVTIPTFFLIPHVMVRYRSRNHTVPARADSMLDDLKPCCANVS